MDNVVEIGIAGELKELEQRCIDYRAELKTVYQINKVQEVTIESLHSELDMVRGELKQEKSAHNVSKNQHSNALALLEDNGLIKQ